MQSMLEKLVSKKAEKHQANAAAWAAFVADVVDERMTSADDIFIGLNVMEKTPAELQSACVLLVERRAWAIQAAEGNAAEESYAGLQSQELSSEKALAALIAKHRQKCEPLGRQIDAARLAISSGADARRRLLETAGDEARQAAFDEIDAQLGEVQVERNLLQQKLRGRRDWVFRVESLGKHAASVDVANLADARAGLRAMIEQDADLAGQTTALQDRRNTAAKRLLEPEAI